MTAALQLALKTTENFDPLPHGAGHYVVALQTKSGELTALRHASAETWRRLTPIIEVVGPRSPGSDPFTYQRVRGWVTRVADAIGPHPCFLDVLRLGANHATTTAGGSRPVLTVMHGLARQRGIAFVPVLRLGAASATVHQIADSVAYDGRGVALRVPLLGTVSADGRSTQILVNEALNGLNVGVTDADLILDLGYISEDTDVDVGFLAAAVEELISLGSWRGVVLVGTTMPRSLGGGVVEAGTVGRLPRQEWRLWSALRRSTLSRLPSYGDYAVQHPDPPMEAVDGKLPLGMRGNIRYTHDTVTVIPRAKAPRHEEGREQYRELCRVLVAQPEFAGRDFTWGDQQIADCANDACEPGWEDHWRGAGTSHHLRFVVDQLASVS